MVNSTLTVGSSLEKNRGAGEAPSQWRRVGDGLGGVASTKQKMLKMSKRTHYVL